MHAPRRSRKGARTEALDWAAIERSLDEWGWARTNALLAPEECARLIATWDDARRFRSRVDMARHRFGEGEYRYFGLPLPPLVHRLREAFFPPLASIANRWMERLGTATRFPPCLTDMLEECARHGQVKPTPLLLRYEAGGYNCLHQDLYGDVVFPLQTTFLLSRPGVDFTGGEILLVEQRPRAQSRGVAIALERGEAVIFASRFRPAVGTRGAYRTQLRHGVSPLRSGVRYTLGIIFHDAR